MKNEIKVNKIRVGGVPEHFNFPWHLAKENDSFLKKNIKLAWTDFGGGTGAMIKALNENEIDVAILLTEGAVNAIAHQQVDMQLVHLFVATPLVWGIHVPAQSSFQSVSELENEKIAISRLGSGSHLMAFLLAEQQSWDKKKLQFEVINNLQGAADSLSNGTSSIFLWEKFTTQPLVDKGIFRRIGEIPTPWACFVVAVKTNFYEQHQLAIQDMIEVVTHSAQLLKSNPNASNFLAERYHLQESQVKQWLQQTDWAYAPTAPVQSVEKAKIILSELGII